MDAGCVTSAKLSAFTQEGFKRVYLKRMANQMTASFIVCEVAPA